MIQIIDYGMGNLRSVQKAFESIGQPAAICTDPAALKSADKVILPGVGAFRDAIGHLQEQGFVEPIREYVAGGRPFLGICLGLQLLFDVSYEDGAYAGLEIVPGEVVRFESQPGLKIPHMGWNNLQIKGDSRLLRGVKDNSWVYFVHSYRAVPKDRRLVVATSDYGVSVPAVIEKDNLIGVQFHPEKSGEVGAVMIKNFIEMCDNGAK